MRATGVLPADEIGTGDHVCWGYNDARDFARPALAWLQGGLDRDRQLLYVSGRDRDRMRRDVALLPDVEELLARGHLRLISLSETYDVSEPLVPDRQLAVYASATEAAVEAGYTGLRVLADVTEAVADPARGPAHLRWEHLADDWMSSHPMDALCAYRRRVVGDGPIHDFAAVHPAVHGPPGFTVPFHLFFDDGRMVLIGSVDSFEAERLERVLTASHVRAGEVRLDVSALEFVDGRAVTAIASWAASIGDAGGRLYIVGASTLLRRVWSALRLEGCGASFESDMG